MDAKRWPKICLREECRAILNKNPSAWGTKMMEALTDMECQDIPTMVWNNADQEAIVERLETGLKIYKYKNN
ncbi:Protein of unknown function [Cotesia congregata]|uniref:Uncharacterized protein n=1 Tax=Cotesia congregata TaxID=51543 RepID=A0A8J2MFW0_COTCN|nr:Protein of unknown function [Cotesia congregata]